MQETCGYEHIQGIVPLPHYVWWIVKTLLSRHIHVPTQFGATILQHYIPHVHVMRCVAYKSTCDIHSHAQVPVSHGLALHTTLSLPTSAHSLKGLAIDTLHIYTQELCQFLLWCHNGASCTNFEFTCAMHPQCLLLKSSIFP